MEYQAILRNTNIPVC